jgi:hypothetical protein
MRLLGIIAALTIGLAGTSVAVAQHDGHHGGGRNGGGNGGSMTMTCGQSTTTSMCDTTNCAGHKEKKDGTCDMSKCCGGMNGCDMMNGDMMGGDMGDMMNQHHGSGGGDMMNCCRQKKTNTSGTASRADAKPNLE